MKEESRLFETMRAEGIARVRFHRVEGRIVIDVPSASGSIAPEEWPGAAWLQEFMLRAGHEEVRLISRADLDFRLVAAVHSTRLGPGAGGLRRHDPVLPETAVLRDVLNLSRAMTYKNAVAETGYGGAKLALHASPLPPLERDRWLAALAEEISQLDLITGPDSGLSLDDYEDLAKLCPRVVGVQSGGTGVSAALGVKEALRATAAALGMPLSEVHVIVQGLGGLGARLARSLCAEGTHLTITDKDHNRIDELLGSLETDRREKIRVIAPYQVLETTADILCPCALGGIIDADAVPSLRVRAICGGANNQLVGDCAKEELHLARALRDAGILYVPDWLASAGGTIHGTMEAKEGDAFELGKAQARVRRVCGWLLDEVLERAKRTDRPPLQIALERVPN